MNHHLSYPLVIKCVIKCQHLVPSHYPSRYHYKRMVTRLITTTLGNNPRFTLYVIICFVIFNKKTLNLLNLFFFSLLKYRAEHHYSLNSLLDSYPSWKFKYSVLSRQVTSRQFSLLPKSSQASSIIFSTWLVSPRYLLHYLIFVTWSIKYLFIFDFSFTCI